MTVSHFPAAAGTGLEQASRICDWSLRAGLVVLEQVTTLCGGIVTRANYLLGDLLWEQVVKSLFATLSSCFTQ